MNPAKYIKTILLSFAVVPGLWAQFSFQVSPLPFNTAYADEVAAVPYNDGLIYCSNRNTHVLINRTDANDHPLYHLYFAGRKDSMKWESPQVFFRFKEISVNAHQGPSTVSSNGQEIYFTLNDKDVNGIFSAQKEGESWRNIRPFVHNSKEYAVAHPSLSKDGKRIFFASDMPGGQGGFDIYYCDRTPTGWGSPVNLGPEVNTPGNELYPFIQENGTLFFSSTGHQSLGGLDIFSVRESNDGKWMMRQHLEPPVNSEYDDFAYSASDTDGMQGYFSSDRNGNTIDLFSFESLFPVFTECHPQEENDYTYEFFEPGSVDLDTTTFRYEWDLGDGTVKKGEEVEHTYATTGTYMVQLNVVDTLTNEVTNRAAVYMVEVLDIEQPYIAVPEKIKAGETVTLDASQSFLPEIDIDEYYWIFGDGTRSTGKSVEHIYTAPGSYEVQLGIIGKSKESGETVRECSSLEIVVSE